MDVTTEKISGGSEKTSFDDLGGVEQKSVDLWKYNNVKAKIESAEPLQVHSQFVETGDHMQWVLKVSSVVLETLGEGEDQINFRASELFNLVQDDNGKLLGFPTTEGSNLMKFVKDLGIKKPEEMKMSEIIKSIIGKEVVVKAYDKDYQGKKRTYLKFKF